MIEGGTISADGDESAGIGAGYSDGGSSVLQTILINGGTISAVGHCGAGIGAGKADAGSASVDTVTIRNSVILASSVMSSGIGRGAGDTATAPWLDITSGSITAIGIVAIGSPDTEFLDFSQPGAALTLDLTANSDYAVKASELEWHEGTVRATTNTLRFFDADDPIVIGNTDFVGQYREMSKVEYLAGDTAFLHFPRFPWDGARLLLFFRHINDTTGRSVRFDPAPELGIIVSLPSPGQYVVEITSYPGHVLASAEGTSFVALAGDNFYEDVQIIDTSVSPTPREVPMSSSAVVAIALGFAALLAFVIIVIILNHKYARRRREDAPAPDPLMSDTRKQGLLEEGSELDEVPMGTGETPQFPPEGVQFTPDPPPEDPPEDPPEQPIFPVDPSFTPEFPDEL
jgi:hypothetical protein